MKKIVLIALFISSVFASSVKIENAYVRATPPSLANSAAFMDIVNNSNQNISLERASSTISEFTELHTHDEKNGKMLMYQVPKIEIKANDTTKLQSGGFHIMFLNLKQKPLKDGQKVDLTLNFSNGEKMILEIPVKKFMKKMNRKMSCGEGKCGK